MNYDAVSLGIQYIITENIRIILGDSGNVLSFYHSHKGSAGHKCAYKELINSLQRLKMEIVNLKSFFFLDCMQKYFHLVRIIKYCAEYQSLALSIIFLVNEVYANIVSFCACSLSSFFIKMKTVLQKKVYIIKS